MTLNFNPLRAMIMSYSHAKIQCQWSIDSEDIVETDRQTEPIALRPSLMQLVTRSPAVAEGPRKHAVS